MPATAAARLKEIRDFALSLPGTQPKSPWPGHDDVAVNDKTFLHLGLHDGEMVDPGEFVSIAEEPVQKAAANLVSATRRLPASAAWTTSLDAGAAAMRGQRTGWNLGFRHTNSRKAGARPAFRYSVLTDREISTSRRPDRSS